VGYPSERLNRSAPDDSEKTSDKKKDDKNNSSLKVAEGSRLGYRETFDYKIPVREGTIPAGYFYSNTEDLGKWMNLWIGEDDIPEEFEEPIAKVKAELKAEGDYTSGWELFSDGVIGHSGGTPNYSSRMVFSEEKKLGVCVLTNLNVAATTDSLCNSIYDLAAGSEARGLSTDIWTVFDLIFIAVSLIGIGILAAAVFGKNKIGLGILDGTLILLLVLIFLIFPMIFGAGMKEILFTWGPWSMTGGIAVLCLDVLCLTGKMIFGKKKTAKTSE
jgi:Beta-lactamase.